MGACCAGTSGGRDISATPASAVDGAPSIVGTPGALETFIGNYNIHERTGGRFQSTHQLIAAFRKGDDLARGFWLTSIHALACALATFINILDPEAILIGGGIAQAGDALFEPLGEALAKIEWRPGGHRVRAFARGFG